MTQRQHVTKMKDKWTGLLIGHGKKVKFRGTFMDKFVEKSADFAGFFGTNFAEKQSIKKQPILWLFLGQISLEIILLISSVCSILGFL